MKYEIKFVKSAVEYNGYMYFVPGNINVLLSLNVSTCEIQPIKWLDFKQPTYYNLFKIDNYIYIIPHFGIQVAKYCLVDGRVDYFVKDEREDIQSVEIVLHNEEIMFIPRIFPGKLFIFSTLNQEFFEDNSWGDMTAQLLLCGKVSRWNVSSDNVYFIFYDSNRLIRFNFREKKLTELFYSRSGLLQDYVVIRDNEFLLLRNPSVLINWRDGDEEKMNTLYLDGMIKLIEANGELAIDTTEGIILPSGKKINVNNRNESNKSSSIKTIKYNNITIFLPWAYSTWTILHDNHNIDTFVLRTPVLFAHDKGIVLGEREAGFIEFIRGIQND